MLEGDMGEQDVHCNFEYFRQYLRRTQWAQKPKVQINLIWNCLPITLQRQERHYYGPEELDLAVEVCPPKGRDCQDCPLCEAVEAEAQSTAVKVIVCW